MTAPVPSRRYCRILAAVEAERGNVIPFPEPRVTSAPAVATRRDGPEPVPVLQPPVLGQATGSSHSIPPREPSPSTLVGPSIRAAPRPGHIMPDSRPGHFPLPPHVGPFPHPPHVGQFHRRQPPLHVLIEAPQPQPLDPAKMAAIEWARRHRDGWDSFGIAVALVGLLWIAGRCAPALFPALFG